MMLLDARTYYGLNAFFSLSALGWHCWLQPSRHKMAGLISLLGHAIYACQNPKELSGTLYGALHSALSAGL